MRPAFGLPAIDAPLEVRVEPAVTPAAEWPLTARLIRRMRDSQDIGIGDTIQRNLGAPGRWFESAMETLGIHCGCADRREWLNRRFPYSSPLPCASRRG